MTGTLILRGLGVRKEYLETASFKEILTQLQFTKYCSVVSPWLYHADERVGNLIVVTTDNPTLIRIHSQIAQLIAVTWLGPTSLGARVITMVLTSPAHFYEW